MRVRREDHGQRNGAALIMSLVLVMVVASLGAAFLQISATGARVQSHSVDQMQAFYAAEAGLSEAFLAVRMGRTGRIATEEDPAGFGESSIWVETLETEDGRVWLRSTAVNGVARASLGLIIDPPDPPLGFFAEEDIVIDSVLLVDGFDSSERSYADEVGAAQPGTDAPESPWTRKSPDTDASPIVVDPTSPHAEAQRAALRYEEVLGRGHLQHFLERQVQILERPACVVSMSPLDPRLFIDPRDFEAFVDDILPMFDAHLANGLFPTSGTAASKKWKRRNARRSRSKRKLLQRADAVHDRLWIHTKKGGVLGSNGNIRFKNSKIEPVAIHGAVVPGVKRKVKGANKSEVTGPTDPRPTKVELDRVAVPDVPMQSAVIHDSLIPLVVSPGATGYESLTVGPSSELVLRGPARVLVGDLTIDSDAKLTLDTRDGDVELYVLGSLAMAPNSLVETTARRANEVTIKAARRHARADAPRLDLDATGDFHGTVYAPESEVRIGSDFEVFGSVAARRLEIGAGARLHFDDESYTGMLPVPTQDSWRILDLPNKANDGAAADLRGLRPLASAHDLANVHVSVQYVDRSGAARTYAGSESAFDWSEVTAVGSVERKDQTPSADRGGNQWEKWLGEWANDDVGDFLKGLGSAWGRDASEEYNETKKKKKKDRKKKKKKGHQ